MDDATMQVITDIVLAVVAVSLPPLIGVLILWLKAKLNLATQEKIAIAIEYAVDAAELLKAQNGWSGAFAKTWVIETITKQFPKVNPEMLNNIIEACVAEMKLGNMELVKDEKLGVIRAPVLTA
jgi:hypothetical protein